MIYRVVQKNLIMFESSRPLSAQCPRQPMNSPSALTEHVSLNLARFFFARPCKKYVLEKQSHFPRIGNEMAKAIYGNSGHLLGRAQICLISSGRVVLDWMNQTESKNLTLLDIQHSPILRYQQPSPSPWETCWLFFISIDPFFFDFLLSLIFLPLSMKICPLLFPLS